MSVISQSGWRRNLLKMAFLMLTEGVAIAHAADCRVQFSRPDINYGQISAGELNANGRPEQKLDERNVRVITVCDDPRLIANAVTGVVHGQGFLFGQHGTVLIGADNAMLDGHPVSIGKLVAAGSFMLKHPGREQVILRNHDVLSPIRNGHLVQGKVFSMRLTLRPLVSNNDIRASDDNDLNADITIGVLSRNDD